jgi:hypothetical protein
MDNKTNTNENESEYADLLQRAGISMPQNTVTVQQTQPGNKKKTVFVIAGALVCVLGIIFAVLLLVSSKDTDKPPADVTREAETILVEIINNDINTDISFFLTEDSPFFTEEVTVSDLREGIGEVDFPSCSLSKMEPESSFTITNSISYDINYVTFTCKTSNNGSTETEVFLEFDMRKNISSADNAWLLHYAQLKEVL